MDNDYELVMPFWIDTDAYSDRDRLMFVCGTEFEMVRQELESGERVVRTIHAENESRVRLMCGKLGRKFAIASRVAEGWSSLEVEPRG